MKLFRCCAIVSLGVPAAAPMLSWRPQNRTCCPWCSWARLRFGSFCAASWPSPRWSQCIPAFPQPAWSPWSGTWRRNPRSGLCLRFNLTMSRSLEVHPRSPLQQVQPQPLAMWQREELHSGTHSHHLLHLRGHFQNSGHLENKYKVTDRNWPTGTLRFKQRSRSNWTLPCSQLWWCVLLPYSGRPRTAAPSPSAGFPPPVACSPGPSVVTCTCWV